VFDDDQWGKTGRIVGSGSGVVFALVLFVLNQSVISVYVRTGLVI
jgi:hypothetical protein